MDPVIPARHELKYLVTVEQAAAISEHLAPYCALDRHSAASSRRQYVIQTLYLDTPRRQLYWASRAEQPGRLKVRVRTYGDGGPVFFELKRKSHGIIRKSRVRVARAGWAQRITGPLSDDAAFVERDFRTYVDRHHLEPAVLVRYRREAWVGLYDDYARVTLDREVRVQPLRTLSLEPDEAGWLPIDDSRSTRGVVRGVVLELKSGLEVPAWMRRLIERFGLQRTSYSKYCLGIEHCFGRRHPLALAPTVPGWS